MYELTLFISQKYLIDGAPRDEDSCPIALALGDYFCVDGEKASAFVEDTVTVVWSQTLSGKLVIRHLSLIPHDDALDFMWEFDKGEPGKPVLSPQEVHLSIRQ